MFYRPCNVKKLQCVLCEQKKKKTQEVAIVFIFFFFAMSNKISIYMIFDVLLAIFAGPERDGLFH